MNFLEFAATMAVAGVYVIPSLVALIGNRERVIETMIINAMLGWTVIGWMFALYLALHEESANPAQITPRDRPAASRNSLVLR